MNVAFPIEHPEFRAWCGGVVDILDNVRNGRHTIAQSQAAEIAKHARRTGIAPTATASVVMAAVEAKVNPTSSKREIKSEIAGATVFDLLHKKFAEPQHICDPWIPEGLNIIAARPKLGKSTIARQKMRAVASGGDLWGSPCRQVSALFLSLEEGERQQKKKFAVFDDPEPFRRVHIRYKWERGPAGVEALRRELSQLPEVRYVVIDSLTRFRAVPDSKTPAFVADYEAVSSLQSLAQEFPGLAIDLIHHTRKMRSDDPLDDISGTYGVSAAVDGYWVLRPAPGGATLHVGGRWWEREDDAYSLVKSGQGQWNLTGTPDKLTPTLRLTLEKVRHMGTASPTRLGDAMGISKQLAHQRLTALLEAGAVLKTGDTYSPL